ncbi:MAG: hypothetical protein IKT40_12360 [Bacilli bacterium]|nr:hypothetical protein [Bacilli bacterium]
MYSKLSLSELYKLANVSYIGATTQSAKMNYSYNNGWETYCIYLAPSTMSGHQVCPNDKWCKQFCLNGSGRNKGETLSRGVEESRINISRIKKTKLFFENRPLFMEIVVREIRRYQKKAMKNNMGFAIRINGTSDLNIESFVYNGLNLLQLFPNVQFYDYTKCNGYLKLQTKYPNYDITLSYNGHNWDKCKQYLNNGGKVAVVFKDNLPNTFMGYKVEDANNDDMRFLNTPGTIMGLHYHKTANDYNGVNKNADTRFIVDPNSDLIF